MDPLPEPGISHLPESLREELARVSDIGMYVLHDFIPSPRTNC